MIASAMHLQCPICQAMPKRACVYYDSDAHKFRHRMEVHAARRLAYEARLRRERHGQHADNAVALARELIDTALLALEAPQPATLQAMADLRAARELL